MAWWRRSRSHGLPEAVESALALGPGERILAVAPSGASRLVATTHRFANVGDDGTVRWLRPWHEIDAASWSRAAGALTVTFVDGGRPVELPLQAQTVFLQVLRERVQASVVAAADLALEPPRRGRAVIRQDLATGELLEQVVLGRGTRPSPEVDRAASAAFALLRDDTGMPAR